MMRLLMALLVVGFLPAAVRATPPDPQALAERIDGYLDARLRKVGVPAAPPANDAEFLRRAYLDITGRIPTPHQVYQFLDDSAADKRARLIDSLLETPRHASHAAALWREILAPETTAMAQARVFRPGFEAWLRQKFRANTPYDVLVRELLAVPLSTDSAQPTPVLRRPEDPNPLAFFAVKEAKPENLAAATTRVFLGVQIECAQCHDHPFAAWSREQFWNQAAFFAGLERTGDGLFGPISENTAVRDIPLAETNQRVAARFLDEAPPTAPAEVSLRAKLADWMTDKDNPYFARAAVNRVWGQLFGRGLVDPVDDFHDDNPPSHPELLDELAQAFVAADFDLRYLMRAIGRTHAYQRTSAQSDPGQADPSLFACMAVKGLTGEQLFDSLVLATGYRKPEGRDRARRQFLTRFALAGKLAEPETSIPQALALMNGSFIADATTLKRSATLTAACELPGLAMAEQVEMLYVSALSRKPTDRELSRIRAYVQTGSADPDDERLADVFWAILNSAEFRLNH